MPSPPAEPLHRLHITYTRALWLQSESPAILLWGGFTVLGLVLAGCLVAASRWFLLLLPFYLVILWLFSGAKALMILLFLLRLLLFGRQLHSLQGALRNVLSAKSSTTTGQWSSDGTGSLDA